MNSFDLALIAVVRTKKHERLSLDHKPWFFDHYTWKLFLHGENFKKLN